MIPFLCPALLAAFLAAPLSPASAILAPHPCQDPGLAPDADDFDSRMGLALVWVRDGKTDAAAGVLEPLAKLDLDEARAERLSRERGRLAAWVDLRDRFLDAQIAAGAKFSFVVEGKKLSVKVVAREGDLLRLAENKRKLETLSVQGLPSAEVAAQMSKGADEFKGSWVRSYGYAVAADKRWKKLLRQESDEASALRKDAADYYPEALVLGSAADELLALGQLGGIGSPEEAQAVLDRVSSLRREKGGLELVRSRAPALAKLAEACLAPLFDRDGVANVVHGKVEPLPDGRVRLTYEFDDEEEAKDFVKDEGYLESVRYSFGECNGEAEAGFVIQENAFVGIGSTTLRHKLWFEGPISVTYQIDYRDPIVEEAGAYCFMLGIADDGKGAYSGAMNNANLRCRDPLSGFEKYAPNNKSDNMITLHEIYAQGIHLDEKGTLTGSIAGEVQSEMEKTPRRAGHVFLWIHSDMPIGVQQLVIETKIGPETLNRARGDWIVVRLAEMGFQ